jgi:NAD-dependent dihydropyrimidine dehydrogenase PreA subunit
VLSKRLAAVDTMRCVACGVCENTCPLGAVKVRRGCYAAVEAERCVGCGKCARLCPVGCIEVKARDEA